MAATVQRVEMSTGRTWTVLGPDHLSVGPVEEFLEFLRVGRDASPHTVRSYASALCGLWNYLDAAGLDWEGLSLPELGGYLNWLRTGGPPGVRRLPVGGDDEVTARRAESTVGTRVAAVGSFYRYQADVHGVAVADRLYRAARRYRSGRYLPALAHTRSGAQRELAVRVRRGAGRPTPLLTPAEVAAILDDCAYFDAAAGTWVGSLRDRLIFATLAESGLRLGELLGLRHCDWHTGQGGTPWLEVVPRDDHPHGARVKYGRFRRVYVSDDLERLYSEYTWQLVDSGAADVVDLEGHWTFVNLARGEHFSPLRPETVYAKVRAIKAHLGPACPADWTPHWFRHTHASALLLEGANPHVVMRRLGHADIQTTINLYGWVTEDAELRALAGWRAFCPSEVVGGE
ncbi:MAG: tyrosine-type recombinase/integrase [Candidatus Dormibacteraeota bacterium]|jgi:integrase/recombinase XerD|nr:tyrosine-type recombinase/integrase [Candidatus Dormibacteraeota bacterium]